MSARVFFDHEKIIGAIATPLEEGVVPVEGACFPSGRVFRVSEKEIFVVRRWQRIEGTDWCIIDFAAPETGYVEKRDPIDGVTLALTPEGEKTPLSYADEEKLYRHFLPSLRKGFLFRRSSGFLAVQRSRSFGSILFLLS